jgi:hypothetical protein
MEAASTMVVATMEEVIITEVDITEEEVTTITIMVVDTRMIDTTTMVKGEVITMEREERVVMVACRRVWPAVQQCAVVAAFVMFYFE